MACTTRWTRSKTPLTWRLTARMFQSPSPSRVAAPWPARCALVGLRARRSRDDPSLSRSTFAPFVQRCLPRAGVYHGRAAAGHLGPASDRPCLALSPEPRYPLQNPLRKWPNLAGFMIDRNKCTSVHVTPATNLRPPAWVPPGNLGPCPTSLFLSSTQSQLASPRPARAPIPCLGSGDNHLAPLLCSLSSSSLLTFSSCFPHLSMNFGDAAKRAVSLAPICLD